MTKNTSIRIILYLLFAISMSHLHAQKTIALETTAEQTFAKKLGTTKAIRDMVPPTPYQKRKKELAKKDRYIPDNFKWRKGHRVIRPEIEHQGEDPLWQKGFSKSKLTPVEPKVNIDGLFAGGSPHDPTGDAGLNYYIQAVNATEIGVYEKNGTLITTFTGNTLWGELGYNSGGDPIIMYDQEFDRWLITEFPFGFGGSANQLLVAISLTDDPLGEYDVYAFGTPRFPDYPKYGIWSNAYSVTTNEETAQTLHAYFINREQLLAGAETVDIQRVSFAGNGNTEAQFLVASPVDWSGQTPPPVDRDPILLALNDASWNTNQDDDRIEIYSVSIDWENPSLTQLSLQSLPVSPYDSYPCRAAGIGFSCVPQAGGSGLDALPEILMNQVHYRNFGTHESLVMSLITDVTDGQDLSGIRWMELRRTENTDWEVYQEGTFAPDDGLHRMLGGIAMDGQGNIGLAYNVSSDSTFVGIRFTGRRVGDPLGVMTIDEYKVVEGTNTINSSGRFADYCHMTIDPADDRTFWYTTEYANGGTSFSRILAFELVKDSLDMGPVALLSPVTGGIADEDEIVTIQVRNFGINTIDSFKVGYILDDGSAVIEDVRVSLQEDETYEHAFARKIDLAELKDYTFKIFTTLEGDESPSNDTLVITLKRLAERDLAVNVSQSIQNTNCGGELDASIEVTNFGIDTIISASLEYFLNDFIVAQVPISSAIAPGETITEIQVLEDLLDGNNTLEVIVSNPNGGMDQIPENDSTKVDFQVMLDGDAITLNLLTDAFPDETTWELLDADSTVVFSGGPYGYDMSETLIQQTFCLDRDQCYTFIIYDSFGDGFSAYGIDGDYTIADAEGNILTSVNNPDFGDSESAMFCVDFECMLTADIDISLDSGAQDGMIIISASNGIGPYQYSINGGVTFQLMPGFENLGPGIYNVVVEDVNNCRFEEEIEMTQCAGMLSVVFTLPGGAGAGDGVISVMLEPVDSSAVYSIDGGANFTSDPIFNDLDAGEYRVVALGSDGCRYEEVVILENMVSTQENEIKRIVNLYPNPTEAGLYIEVTGVNLTDLFIPITIFNNEGRIVQRQSLTRYDNAYKGEISMYYYPSGQYYIKIHHPEITRLQKFARI